MISYRNTTAAASSLNRTNILIGANNTWLAVPTTDLGSCCGCVRPLNFNVSVYLLQQNICSLPAGSCLQNGIADRLANLTTAHLGSASGIAHASVDSTSVSFRIRPKSRLPGQIVVPITQDMIREPYVVSSKLEWLAGARNATLCAGIAFTVVDNTEGPLGSSAGQLQVLLSNGGTVSNAHDMH